MASLKLQDGRVINFPDGLQPEQVKKISDAATQQAAPQPPAAANGGFDQFKGMVQSGQMNMPTGVSLGDVGQRTDDAVRSVANGASLGFIDRAAGYLNGTGTDAERAKSSAATERLGPVGPALEIGGSLLPVAGAARLGMTATKLPGLVGKIGGMALDGAGFGAVNAAGHDQNIPEGAAMGAGFGAFGQIAGKAIGKGYSFIKGKPEVPTLDTLIGQKNAAYKAVDNSGATFAPQRLRDLHQGITDIGHAYELDPQLHPKTAAVLAILQKRLDGTPKTLSQIDDLRQIAKSGVYDTGAEKADRRIGRKIIGEIDNFTNSVAPEGGSLATNDSLLKARELNTRISKAEQIDEKLHRAEIQASKSGTGANIENTMRQRIADILLKKGGPEGFSPAEVTQMEKVTAGSKTQNALRKVGRYSPAFTLHGMGGSGVGALIGTAIPGIGPALGAVIPPAVGAVSKALSDRAARLSIEKLSEMVRNGGPVEAAKLSPAAKQIVEALMRSMAIGGTAALQN